MVQDGTSSNRTFSGNDNFGESLKYSVNRVLVFKNGVLLRNGTDYSATNGTSITLASSVANSDIIRITSFTGSYEGVAGATQGAVTQWTKTGGGSIYNHDTESGVVINSDDSRYCNCTSIWIWYSIRIRWFKHLLKHWWYIKQSIRKW